MAVDAPVTATPAAATAQPRREPGTPRHPWLGQALGSLWLLDGAAQLQARLFGPTMVTAILQPAGAGNPSWANLPLQLAIQAFVRHPVLANTAVALVQGFLGATLWLRSRSTWPYALSLLWSLLLWPFGQAFGGILSAQASLLTGAPGSAIIYAVLTWLAWPGTFTPARGPWLLGAIWALGAVLQARPVNFTAARFTAITAANAVGQPRAFASLLRASGALLASHAVFCNGVLVVTCLACAAALWSPRWRRAGLALSAACALVLWVFGQALGMILTGSATDPNTAPLLALIAAASWPAAPRPTRRGDQGPGGAKPWPRRTHLDGERAVAHSAQPRGQRATEGA